MNWNKFKARDLLQNLIAGKAPDAVVDPNKIGKSTVVEISVYIPSNNFSRKSPGWLFEQVLKVHADTKVSAIASFLEKATDDNICLTVGPKDGIRLISRSRSRYSHHYNFTKD